MMNKKIYVILGLIMLLLNVIPLTSAYDDVADVGRTDRPFSWLPEVQFEIFEFDILEGLEDLWESNEFEEEEQEYKDKFDFEISDEMLELWESNKFEEDKEDDNSENEYTENEYALKEKEGYTENEYALREEDESDEEDQSTNIYLSADLQINNLFVDIKDDEIEVYTVIENKGNKKATGVELKYHLLGTNIFDIKSLGTVYSNKKSTMLNYLDISDLDKESLTLMVEVMGNNGQYDVDYFNLKLEKDSQENNVFVFVYENESQIEKPRGFFQRIIDWFLNQFRSL